MEIEFAELSSELPTVIKSKSKKSKSKSSKSKTTRTKHSKTTVDKGQISIDEIKVKESLSSIEDKPETIIEKTTEEIVENKPIDVEVTAEDAVQVTDEGADKTEDSVVDTAVADKSMSEVVEIPRGDSSILGNAIKNKGKYFAEKNAELVQAEKHPYYLRSSIMTPAEETLFKIMDSVFNKYLHNIKAEILIFPKVRLADVVDVQDVLKSRKSYFYTIAQKHIDFLIYDKKDMKLICAVELDDIYHSRSDRKARDRFVDDTLRGCGVTIFRVDAPIKEVNEGHLTAITDYILDYYSPTCCKCGNHMELKRSRQRHNYGHRFYGCLGWKPGGAGCDNTIDID